MRKYCFYNFNNNHFWYSLSLFIFDLLIYTSMYLHFGIFTHTMYVVYKPLCYVHRSNFIYRENRFGFDLIWFEKNFPILARYSLPPPLKLELLMASFSLKIDIDLLVGSHLIPVLISVSGLIYVWYSWHQITFYIQLLQNKLSMIFRCFSVPTGAFSWTIQF